MAAEKTTKKKDNKMFLIIGAVAVVVVLLLGAFMLRGGSSSVPGMAQNPQDLIASAMTGTGSVKCEYTGEDGAVVTAYIKNGQVRTDITGGPDGGGSFLMKDKTTWTWSDSTKEGVMFVLPEITPVAGQATGEMQTASDEVAADLEQYKDSCKSETVSDSVFEVPTDVNFQDFSSMMSGMEQEIQSQMQEIPQEYQQYLNQQ